MLLIEWYLAFVFTYSTLNGMPTTKVAFAATDEGLPEIYRTQEKCQSALEKLLIEVPELIIPEETSITPVCVPIGIQTI